jgi:hypothetical protein
VVALIGGIPTKEANSTSIPLTAKTLMIITIISVHQ